MTEEAKITERLCDIRISRRNLLYRGAVLGASLPLVGSVLAACGGANEVAPDATGTSAPGAQGTEPASTGSPAAQEEGRFGGTMIILAEHEVSSLSPDDTGTWVHTAIVRQMHDGLLEVDEMFEVVPALAESYEISGDGLEYTFHLQQDVLFHDGEPFDADDVKYTYEFHMNPDNATSTHGTVTVIESVEAPDESTFVIHMKEPDASFITFGAPTMIYPQHYHSSIGEDAFKSEPIGTGPFKLKEYRPAEFTLVEAFEDHWRGRPYIDELRMNVVPEPSIRALQIQTGEADANVSPGAIEDHLQLAEDEQITTFRTAAVTISHMALNHTHPALGEKDVRQAMMYAIDRETIIEDIFLGAATLATANLAPSLEAWYNPNVKQYPYDPDQAREMLDAAGWVVGSDGIRERDGQRMHFVLTLIAGLSTAHAETIQQYLKDVGIEMEIREAPISAIQDGLRNGDVHATLWQWTYGGWDGEPDSRYTMQTGAYTNWNSWSNERVDELLLEGIQQTGPAARKPVYDEIQEIVAEEVPMLFIAFPTLFQHFSPRIKGLPDYEVRGGNNLFAKVREFWIEE